MQEPEGFTCQTTPVNGVEISYFTGGHGAPIVLLHGYPQNKAIWHKIASTLAKTYTVVAPDLRGYGDSSKPDASNEDHSIYCKRTSALDIVTLTERLDLGPFHIVGHDRGARVAHRMALDHPKRVKSLTSLDVMPTQAAFDNMDSELAFAWFHWHLMRQPYPLPEQLIGNSAGAYFDFLMERWCATAGAISPEAHDHYKRQFCDPETIHATCAEYRSVALDLEHDEVDRGHKLACSVLAIWGANTAKRPGWQTGKDLDILAAWRDRAEDVEGHALDCGHFIPEEKPEELQELLLNFFARVDAQS
jgi:haloacetate dehalogenase